MSGPRERSDGDLVRAALVGEKRAFGALVERYMRPAFLTALSVVGRREDAEDAAQESFVVALERLEQCRNPDRFGGWFLTIVRNRARNLARREGIRRVAPLPRDVRSSEAGPEGLALRGELRTRLEEALEELPEVWREVVLLHDLEGWKHREIAERLGIPPGTVRSHLHHARTRLRELLGGMGEGEQGGTE